MNINRFRSFMAVVSELRGPLLLLLFLFFLFFGPCSGQRELEIDVALMARIFDELVSIRQPPHYEFYAIRFSLTESEGESHSRG